MTPALFAPLTLRGLTLPNRIAVSPMTQYSGESGCPVPWHSMHVGSMAVSGAGLVIMEATSVEANGRTTPGCLGLRTQVSERTRPHGINLVSRAAAHQPGVHYQPRHPRQSRGRRNLV